MMNALSPTSRSLLAYGEVSWGFASLHPRLYAIAALRGLKQKRLLPLDQTSRIMFTKLRALSFPNFITLVLLFSFAAKPTACPQHQPPGRDRRAAPSATPTPAVAPTPSPTPAETVTPSPTPT